MINYIFYYCLWIVVVNNFLSGHLWEHVKNVNIIPFLIEVVHQLV